MIDLWIRVRTVTTIMLINSVIEGKITSFRKPYIKREVWIILDIILRNCKIIQSLKKCYYSIFQNFLYIGPWNWYWIGKFSAIWISSDQLIAIFSFSASDFNIVCFMCIRNFATNTRMQTWSTCLYCTNIDNEIQFNWTFFTIE